jgi:hypothetical protein
MAQTTSHSQAMMIPALERELPEPSGGIMPLVEAVT